MAVKLGCTNTIPFGTGYNFTESEVITIGVRCGWCRSQALELRMYDPRRRKVRFLRRERLSLKSIFADSFKFIFISISKRHKRF